MSEPSTPSAAIALTLEALGCGVFATEGAVIPLDDWPIRVNFEPDTEKTGDKRMITVFDDGGVINGRCTNGPGKCEALAFRIRVRACDHDEAYLKICEIEDKFCENGNVSVSLAEKDQQFCIRLDTPAQQFGLDTVGKPPMWTWQSSYTGFRTS